MEARLAPRADEPELAATGITPLRTPWRVVMIGTEAGRLIESNIVINLNPPSAIADKWARRFADRVMDVVDRATFPGRRGWG